MEMWEPKTPGILWATPGLLRDCFTFLLHVMWTFHRINKKVIKYSLTQIYNYIIAMLIYVLTKHVFTTSKPITSKINQFSLECMSSLYCIIGTKHDGDSLPEKNYFTDHVVSEVWPSDQSVGSLKYVQLRCLTKYLDAPFKRASIRNPRVNTSLLAVRFDQVLLGWDVVLGTATRCVLDGLSGEYHSTTKFEARRLPSVGDLKFKSKSLQYG